jgi:hypothetical protein
VEEPNLRQFDSKVGKEDETGATPLFGNGGYFLLRKSTMATCTTSGYTYILNLVLVEVGQSVYNYPWQRPPEVDDLVHDEGHDASR